MGLSSSSPVWWSEVSSPGEWPETDNARTHTQIQDYGLANRSFLTWSSSVLFGVIYGIGSAVGRGQILKCVNFLHLSTFLHILYAHLDNFTRNLEVMKYEPVSHDTYLKNNWEATAEWLVYLVWTIMGKL